MKNCLYLFLLIFFFISCRSTINSQERKEVTLKKNKISKPKFIGIVNQKFIAPNTIQLEGYIVREIKSMNICNENNLKTIEVKVIKVLGSGSSIVNMLIKNKTYTFTINNKLINKEVITKVKLGKLLFFNVKEGLCKHLNKTIYGVLSF